MAAYYNEIDPYAADWLENLIAEGLIAPGVVDRRSIADVQADDLVGYDQCHFFAGIGGWSLALRLAGWPDDRPIWTGSCPCQPFSSAGKRRGTADARHLWPECARLIAVGRPPAVLGEQVASKAGRAWLAGVRADLEAMGYAVGAADLCAAGIGAPHIRQRLFWVADASADLGECGKHQPERGSEGRAVDGWAGAGVDRLEHSPLDGRQPRRAEPDGRLTPRGRGDGGLVDAIEPRPQGHAGHGEDGNQPGRLDADPDGSVAPPGAWTDCLLVACADGKARRISAQPGDEPLADGLPRGLGPLRTRRTKLAKLAAASLKGAKQNRVGRLRGYGNAIVPEVAAEFIRAWKEARNP